MKKLLLFLFVITVAVTIFVPQNIISAASCRGTCHSCGPRGGGQQSCSCNDDGAEETCCYDASCNGDCDEDPGAPCGNCGCFCDKPPECECTPVACPPGNPPTKFMTRTIGNGNGRSCGDPCNPNTFACDPKHVNAPPSCSILPASITMSRNDAPKSFNLTAHDNDYGDTVQVTHVRVVDTAGHLKSCVDVLTTGGGSVENLTVKTGSDDPAKKNETTTLLVDSRYARGIYENVNGRSLCSGFLEVEIRDLDSDLNGPDTSDYATCKVAIEVENAAPQLTNVTLSDRDAMSSIRDLGATGNGNLIDGRAQLFVGSSITTQSKVRAHICNEPLSILDPIKCPMGGEGYSTFSRRRNPLLLTFTVSDANGADDIMQGGFWLQRTSLNQDSAVLPKIGGGNRNSISSIYSEGELPLAPDMTQIICFKKDQDAPERRQVSIPVICPSDCVACAQKEGVVAVAGNPNALTFKFGIYLNDSDAGNGMRDEEYGFFLSVLDKVNVPINNVVNKGPNGWMKFDRNGVACTAASCPGNSDFALVYDPVAPTVNLVTWVPIGLEKAKATVSFSDKAGGSGLGGVTNRFMVRQEMLDNEPLGDRHWANDDVTGALLDGNQDRFATNASPVVIEGKGLIAGEEIVAGLCVYDRAGNMKCGRNGTQYVFLAPWLKTSYGDIYSAKGGGIPFSQTLPTDDGTTNDETKTVNAPFDEQIFTAGTGLFMTGGSTGLGLGISGGHLYGGINVQLGFDGAYRTGTNTSAFNVYSYNPALPGNEYERLRALASLNCSLMNTTSTINCQSDGNISTIGQAPYNIIRLNNTSVSSTITCTNTNVIFVEGSVEISGQVVKSATVPNSGCIFVVSNGSSLLIKDTPSDARAAGAAGQPGKPTADRFDAAIIASSGATVKTEFGARGATTKSTDRLVIKGWVYSASTVPLFKRNLAPVDNRRFPSEMIVYDASLLDLFRPILGIEKTVDLTCGTSEHVLCKTQE